MDEIILGHMKYKLIEVIQNYLTKVQGGLAGTPTMEELMFCAKLHQILEEIDHGRRILP